MKTEKTIKEIWYNEHCEGNTSSHISIPINLDRVIMDGYQNYIEDFNCFNIFGKSISFYDLYWQNYSVLFHYRHIPSHPYKFRLVFHAPDKTNICVTFSRSFDYKTIPDWLDMKASSLVTKLARPEYFKGWHISSDGIKDPALDELGMLEKVNASIESRLTFKTTPPEDETVKRFA